MPPKRRAPATSSQSAQEVPEDQNNLFQTAKQIKAEALDLITEFSRPQEHDVKIKHEQTSVKCEPTQPAKVFVKGSRTLLSVPHSQKDIAREEFGAEWDNDAKRWYVQNSWCVEDGAIGFFILPDLQPLIQRGWRPQPPVAFSAKELELCRRWAKDDAAAEAELQTAFPPTIVCEPITILDCKYRDKDKAKAMGASFETGKKWYIPNVPVDPSGSDHGNAREPPSYFLHPFHKLVFSPWLPQPPVLPQSPSQLSNPASPLPASPTPTRKLNTCPTHGVEVHVMAASPSAQNPGRLYEKCPVKDCNAVLPGTKPGLWRWHAQRNVCPIHHKEVIELQVKNGMSHNIGRWFEKCPVSGCTARLPGTDVGLWRWSDGTLPFSSESQQRFEEYHGLDGDGGYGYGGYDGPCVLM
jgi:hypothetical protein